MKMYEIIGIYGICVNAKDEVKYQNKLSFDDCFNIFDVYAMLRTYFMDKGISSFQIREL